MKVDAVILIGFFAFISGIIAFNFWKQGIFGKISKKERIKKRAQFRKEAMSNSPQFKQLASKNNKRPRNIFGQISNLWKVWRSSKKTSSGELISSQFVEKEAHEKGFSAHYEKQLRPLVKTYETSRQQAIIKASKILRRRLLVFGILVVCSVPLVLSLPGFLPILILFVILGGFGWIAHGVNKPLYKYEESRKEKVFDAILSFTDFRYSEKAAIEGRMHDYLDFDIVPNYDYEDSEDNLSGDYKGVKVELFETRLQNEGKQEGGRTQYYDVFKGLICIFSTHKSFTGKTILKKDKGSIGNWFADKLNKLEPVKLEDPRFEKEFEAFSTDQVEARTLLTPSFMERITELKNLLEGKSVECSFYNSSLLIMIPIKRDLFELGSVFQTVDFVEDSRTLLKELSIVFTIVDSLRLDLDVGI